MLFPIHMTVLPIVLMTLGLSWSIVAGSWGRCLVSGTVGKTMWWISEGSYAPWRDLVGPLKDFIHPEAAVILWVSSGETCLSHTLRRPTTKLRCIESR